MLRKKNRKQKASLQNRIYPKQITLTIDPELEAKLKRKQLQTSLERSFSEILKAHDRSELSVEILITGEKLIRSLNRQFRGKNKTTDVLSFHSGIPGLLGSIAIDLMVAQKQAREYRHSLERELFELCIHGLFHLLGFDHENEAEAHLMKQYELYWTSKVKI